ncbi:MAG TPA: DUF885 family protein [Steroidobacteraceae bacterium]|nr:DUF885 family protein [Steroidobacteraceae bacterium]
MDRRTMMISTAVAAAFAAGSSRVLAQAGKRSESLNALFDQFVKENLDLSPTLVTALGLDTGTRAKQKSEIDDSSEAGIERQKKLVASQVARLKAFDRATLSPADAVSYDVVMYGLRTNDEANRAFTYGPGGAGQPYVISQLTGNYQQVPVFLDNQHTIETKADADAYLARLSAFAISMNQEVEVARHDMGMGVTPPDFVLAKTLMQMQALRAPAPEASSLTESVVRRTQQKGISGDYGRQAALLVKEKVYPALDGQIAVVRDMQKGATHAAGVSRLPKGQEYYTASLVNWATTAKTAAEIHRLGLEIVKEQTAQIDVLMRKLNMTQGTVGSRLNAMYKDPKLLYANTDAAKEILLADLNRRVQSIQAQLPRYFGALPKAGVLIKRVPKEVEAGSPGGHYDLPSLDGKRPGIYWINLRDTGEQPKWLLPTLTYHESIPGHHLQLSIQQEAKLPMLRKMTFYSAYAEGWALYAEQLAAEMGEYDNDPLGHIGQLHDSMMRAVRLVVDSGLHGMNWSREQSVTYFSETLGDPQATAVTEVERYCVWPGQACSYMLGKLTFLAQRSKAQQRLGSNYDIRKFHDSVLLAGAVPLDVLEQINA